MERHKEECGVQNAVHPGGLGLAKAVLPVYQIQMKKCLSFGALFLAALIANAQETKTNQSNLVISIPAAEAKEHLGEQAAVKGTIAEVNQTERITRLNFDKPYPKQSFTAVIFSQKTNLFSELDKLKGKSVEVRGKIVAYRDRPQIVVNSTNQLKIVEPEAKTKADKND